MVLCHRTDGHVSLYLYNKIQNVVAVCFFFFFLFCSKGSFNCVGVAGFCFVYDCLEYLMSGFVSIYDHFGKLRPIVCCACLPALPIRFAFWNNRNNFKIPTLKVFWYFTQNDGVVLFWYRISFSVCLAARLRCLSSSSSSSSIVYLFTWQRVNTRHFNAKNLDIQAFQCHIFHTMAGWDQHYQLLLCFLWLCLVRL